MAAACSTLHSLRALRAQQHASCVIPACLKRLRTRQQPTNTVLCALMQQFLDKTGTVCVYSIHIVHGQQAL